jgi:hypothetical protein
MKCHFSGLANISVGGTDDQLKLFNKKFGRESGPNDPLFFNPNSDTPRPINPQEAEAEIACAST